MKKWIIGSVVVSLLALGEPPPVLAQKYVPRAMKKKARKLQFRGIRAYKRHQYQKAVKYFLDAFQAWPRRELNFNIALCYGRLGDKIKAVIYLRKFIKDASARELASIPKWMRDIREEVAVVNIQGPDGALVTMDGKEVGNVPLELVILPGMHLFVVEKDGRRIAKRDWDVKPGLRRVWEVIEAKPRPQEDPRRPVEPPPRRVVPVVVKPPPPPPDNRLHMAYFITAAALALAAGGAAVYTGLEAQSLHDEYKDNPTRDTRDKGLLMRNTTNALIGVASAMGAAAVILAIFTRWKPRTERAASLPAVGIGAESGGAQVTVFGRF